MLLTVFAMGKAFSKYRLLFTTMHTHYIMLLSLWVSNKSVKIRVVFIPTAHTKEMSLEILDV